MYKIYELHYSIDVEDMIRLFEDGKGAKVELYQDETCDIFPLDAHGYEDCIYALFYSASDYFECGDYKSYMDFLATCENVINIDGFELLISYK